MAVVAMLAVFPVSGRSNTKSDDEFVVVIDAGHGGKDVGAADNGVTEKSINLGVALKAGEMIKEKLKNVKVVFTRDDDTYLTLQQRADKANKAKGDLFISVHTNSVDKSNKNRTTVNGSSVYVLGLHKDQNNMAVARRENAVIELESNYQQKYSGFDPTSDASYIIFEMAQKKNLNRSIRFADMVQKELVKTATRKDRGVHQAGFWVLWATSMPAVLIELDFICNPNQAKYMGSSQGQQQLATAIFNAVKAYVEVSSRKDTVELADDDEKRVEQKQEDGAVILVAAKEESSASRDHLTAETGRRPQAVAKRRRRSQSAREASGKRVVETESIPLTENVYAAAATVTERPAEDNAPAPADARPEKKRADKKAKKETKKEDPEVRTYNNRKVNVRSEHRAKLERAKTVYSIQILASPDKIKPDSPRFCGLSPIRSHKENDLYKYTYGETEDRKEIDRMLGDVRKKIPDAFVVKSTRTSSAKK